FSIDLAGYKEQLAAFLDPVGRHIIQGRRSNRLPGAQIEPRMMPGAVHRAIDHQPFCQWTAIMCARCGNGEKVVAASGHKNRFAKRMSQKHFSVAEVFSLMAFFKIRSLKFAGSFSHRISFFVLTYESHWTHPATVLCLDSEWKKADAGCVAKNTRVPLAICEGRKESCTTSFSKQWCSNSQTALQVYYTNEILSGSSQLFDVFEDLSPAGAARARACGRRSGTRRALGTVDRSAMRIAPGFFPLGSIVASRCNRVLRQLSRKRSRNY